MQLQLRYYSSYYNLSFNLNLISHIIKMTNSSLPSDLNFLRPVVIEDLKRYGNKYDGGYVLPKSSIEKMDAMISMGINDDWSLESQISTIRPELHIDAYDHTISRRKFYREFRLEFYKLMFFRSNLSKVIRKFYVFHNYGKFFKGHVTHYPNRVYNRINYPYDITIDNIFSKLPSNSKNIFLKMDIEGGEYRTLESIFTYADRIELLAIEFHDTYPFREKFSDLIKGLQKYFAIVHIHGNNDGGAAEDGLPETLEITMIRKSNIHEPIIYRNRLPLAELDAPNGQELPDLIMSFID